MTDPSHPSTPPSLNVIPGWLLIPVTVAACPCITSFGTEFYCPNLEVWSRGYPRQKPLMSFKLCPRRIIINSTVGTDIYFLIMQFNCLVTGDTWPLDQDWVGWWVFCCDSFGYVLTGNLCHLQTTQYYEPQLQCWNYWRFRRDDGTIDCNYLSVCLSAVTLRHNYHLSSRAFVLKSAGRLWPELSLRQDEHGG